MGGGAGTKSCSGGTMEENSSCSTGISCLCPGPPLPSLSSLLALFLTPLSRVESAQTLFDLGMGEAANLIRGNKGSRGTY